MCNTIRWIITQARIVLAHVVFGAKCQSAQILAPLRGALVEFRRTQRNNLWTRRASSAPDLGPPSACEACIPISWLLLSAKWIQTPLSGLLVCLLAAIWKIAPLWWKRCVRILGGRVKALDGGHVPEYQHPTLALHHLRARPIQDHCLG
jgi:hypothetical protein